MGQIVSLFYDKTPDKDEEPPSSDEEPPSSEESKTNRHWSILSLWPFISSGKASRKSRKGEQTKVPQDAPTKTEPLEESSNILTKNRNELPSESSNNKASSVEYAKLNDVDSNKDRAKSIATPITEYPGGALPPDFGPILKTDAASTPERPVYNLDANALLARERWGIQQITAVESEFLQPLPWRPDLRYNILDQFVNLEIQLLDRSGQRPKRMIPSMKNLVDALETEGKQNRPRHLIFRGEAGSGKTTFFRYWAHCWSKDEDVVDRLDSKRIILIYYDLKNLGPDDELDQEILKIMHAHSGLDPKAVELTEKCLQYYQGETVLIVDGYDSLNDQMKEKVKMMLKATGGKYTVFSRGTICLVSRFETDKEILYLFERQFKFMGFSKENVQEFLKKHVGPDLSGVTAQLKRYHLDINFDFEGLAPVTILIVLEHLNDKDKPKSQYDLILRVIMSLGRRANEIDNFGITIDQMKDKLHRLGDWLHSCTLKKITGFPLEEFEEFMQEDYHFIVRCGIIQRRLCPPLGKQGLMEAQHIMYWKVIEAFFLKKKWLSLTTDIERKDFLIPFEFDSKGTVCVFVYQLSEKELQVSLRFLAGSREICFEWRIEDGNIIFFEITLEKFRESSNTKDSFRVSVELQEDRDTYIKGILENIEKLFSVSVGNQINEQVQNVVRNVPQEFFILSLVDLRSKENNLIDRFSSSQDDNLRSKELPSESLLFDVSSYLQISLGSSWAFREQLNRTLFQFLNLRIEHNGDNDSVDQYLLALMNGLRAVRAISKYVFKFRYSAQIILKGDIGKLEICDNVYCEAKYSFNSDEILKNSSIFSRYKWRDCYEITLTMTKNQVV